MTTKRKILILGLIAVCAACIIGSFAIIKQNKALAVEMLKDANSKNIAVTCDKIDAGIFSIEYSDLKIHEKGNSDPSKIITVNNITIAKSPSLATLISRDLNQGKTSIVCESVRFPLAGPISKQYGAKELELNISASSDVANEDVTSVATVEVPKLGSATYNVALNVNPKLYEMGNNVDIKTIAHNIALKSFEFTLENAGGVQELLTANNIQENSITIAEKELQKLPAVDYQADLKSFVDGSKKLSIAYSFPDNTSVPLEKLFLTFLMMNPNDPTKIIISSF